MQNPIPIVTQPTDWLIFAFSTFSLIVSLCIFPGFPSPGKRYELAPINEDELANKKALRAFRWRRWLGRVSRNFSREAICNRCGMSRRFCNPHWIEYAWGIEENAGVHCRWASGTAAMCEHCHQQLTPESRLPYYELLFLERDANGSAYTEEQQAVIREQVLAGK